MIFVSCVMPTRGRRTLAAQAFQCFLDQTYLRKELVILDDTDDPSFPEGLTHPLVKYYREEKRLTIPVKRNKVNRLASGPVIAHFDSDDWSDPERLTDQMKRFEEHGLAMTGYHSMLFATENGDAYKYRYHGGERRYALGTSLLYTKAWWSSHPFPENRAIASDNRFVEFARDKQQLISADAEHFMVARVHPDNTSKKDLQRGGSYIKVENNTLPEKFRCLSVTA